MKITHAAALLAIVAAPATLAVAQSVPVNGEPHNTNSNDALTGVNRFGSITNANNSTANSTVGTLANTATPAPDDESGRAVQRLNPRLGGQ